MNSLNQKLKGGITMNIVKELEQILRHPTFMGNDITGCNLAVNAILDRIDELGLEIVEKKKED
jgi:hypothetical protein